MIAHRTLYMYRTFSGTGTYFKEPNGTGSGTYIEAILAVPLPGPSLVIFSGTGTAVPKFSKKSEPVPVLPAVPKRAAMFMTEI